MIGIRNARRNAFLLLLTSVAACGKGEEDMFAVGTLERVRIELIAEAQEQIVEIFCREGEQVEAGQPLLQLDERLHTSQVTEAKAARDRAKAILAELLRGTRPELIDAARAEVAEFKSTLVEARSLYARIEPLVGSGVEAPSRLDEAEAGVGKALGRLDASKADLERLLEGATVEELDKAHATLAKAEAALTTRLLTAERLLVHAPRPGVIDLLPYEVGERPPPGSTVVVMLADERPYARVYVPEPLRVHVVQGTLARIRIDGYTLDFEGIVRTISTSETFTPYFALTEHDRGRLAYVAEVDLVEPKARNLPTGVPVEVRFEVSKGETQSASDE